MGFQPGNKIAKGRPKGSPNKRSVEVAAIMAEAGHCPTEKLIHLARVAEARFEAEIEMVNSGRWSPMESSAAQYLKMAIDANKELASFVNPKLKAIEQVKGPSPLDGMTAEQKLQAMKEAVKALQAQVKAEG